MNKAADTPWLSRILDEETASTVEGITSSLSRISEALDAEIGRRYRAYDDQAADTMRSDASDLENAIEILTRLAATVRELGE